MSSSPILVIEDDDSIRRGMCDALRFAGYHVLDTPDGSRGLHLVLESGAMLVLLDVMLPSMNGFDVLRDIRRSRPTLPVIMVTARGAEQDRVRGLRDGADDYVTKPFSAMELLARVEAVLRRSPGRSPDVGILHAPGRRIDLLRREIIFENGQKKELSQREADILRHLATQRDRVVERDELLQHVWGLNPRGISTRTVDMQIVRLREKLSSSDAAAPLILTVRGKGYKLDASVQIGAACT